MAILDALKPSRLADPFLSVSIGNINCVTVQCTLCAYGSRDSLVSAPRQVHLLKHIVKFHWAWWLSLDWEDEIPPVRYRTWKKSKFSRKEYHENGQLWCSDSDDNISDIWMHCDDGTCDGYVHTLSGGTASPCDMYEEETKHNC